MIMNVEAEKVKLASACNAMRDLPSGLASYSMTLHETNIVIDIDAKFVNEMLRKQIKISKERLRTWEGRYARLNALREVQKYDDQADGSV